MEHTCTSGQQVGVGCAAGGPILTMRAAQDFWPSVVPGCEWGECSCVCHRPWEVETVAVVRL